MSKNILIVPIPDSTNPRIYFSGSASSSIRLEVLEDGSVSFIGSAGTLFGIEDGLSGSLMSVNDISGIPIFEVFSWDRVDVNGDLYVDGDLLIVSGNLAKYGTDMSASYDDRTLIDKGYLDYITGSMIAESASYAVTSSHVTDPFIAYINKTNYFTGSQEIRNQTSPQLIIGQETTGTETLVRMYRGEAEYYWDIGMFTENNSDLEFQSQTGGTVLHLDYTGNVGLGGISNPSEKLHISGSVLISGSAYGTDYGLWFSDGDTGIYEPLSNQLALYAGGSITAYVSSTYIRGQSNDRFEISTALATSTIPSYTFRGDTNTGIGRAGVDTGSLIAGGVNVLNFHPGETDVSGSVFIKGTIGASGDGLYFGSGRNYGIYQHGASQFDFIIGGTRTGRLGVGYFDMSQNNGPRMVKADATATVPTFLPGGGDDENTGIGHAAADTGSLIAGGVNVLNWYPGWVDITGNQTLTGNLTVDGNLTANQFIVSSSVTYMTQSFSSGSTMFGDSIDDTHIFTGSVYITGSLVVNDQILDTDYIAYTNVENSFTGSQYISGSLGIGTDSPSSILNINGGIGSLSTGITFGDGDTGLYEHIDDQIRLVVGSITVASLTTSGLVGGNNSSYKALINISNSSATVPGFTFVADNNTGMGQSGPDTGSLIAGGVNVLNWNADANVGIGTTPSDYTLDVLNDTITTGHVASFGGLYHTVRYIDTPTQFYWQVGDDTFSSPAEFRITGPANTPAWLVMKPDGKVGIGEYTPEYLLDVAGSSRHGAALTDNHYFTGSVHISGSVLTTGLSTYTTDLSGTYTDRSLVDKGWVDSITGSISGLWSDEGSYVELSNTKEISAGTYQIINLGYPSSSNDAASKLYVDNLVSAASGGDMLKTVYDSNDDGTVNSADSASYSSDVDRTLLMDSSSYSLLALTASYALDATSVSGTPTYLAQFNTAGDNVEDSIAWITGSTSLYISGALQVNTDGVNVFGDELTDQHEFTGSVYITGSLLLNGEEIGASSETASYVTDPYIAYINKTNQFSENQNITGSLLLSGSLQGGAGLYFGDGDTGFYEYSDDMITVRVGGTSRWFMGTTYLRGNTADTFNVDTAVASSTNPAFSFRNDEDTGMGKAGANTGSLIAGGTNVLNWHPNQVDITGSLYMDGPIRMSGSTSTNHGIWFGNDLGKTGLYNLNNYIYFKVNNSQMSGYTSLGMFLGAGNEGNVYIMRDVATSTLPPYSFVGDLDTGMGWAGADTGSLIAGGTNVLNWNSSGFVGIGTQDPQSVLDIKASSGDILLIQRSGQTQFNLGAGSVSGTDYLRWGANSAASFVFGDNHALLVGTNVGINNLSSGDLSITGNFGVKTTTAEYDIDVSGSSRHGYDLTNNHYFTGSVHISGSLVVNEDTILDLENIAYTNVTNQFSENQNITGSLLLSGSFTLADGGLKFGDGDTGLHEVSDDVLYFRVNTIGQAYIGSGFIRGSSTGDFQINTKDATSTTPAFTIRGDDNTGMGWAGNDTGSLIAGGTNVLNWTAEGHVGIGTQDPEYIFHVKSSTSDGMIFNTNGGDAFINISSSHDASVDIKANQSGTQAGEDSMIRFFTGTQDKPRWVIALDSTDNLLKFVWNEYKAGTVDDRFFFDQYGRFGIYTTPEYNLDVSGSTRLGYDDSIPHFITGSVFHSGSQFHIGGAKPRPSSANHHLFVDGHVMIGTGIDYTAISGRTDFIVSHPTGNSRFLFGQNASFYGGLIWDYDATPANANLQIYTDTINDILIITDRYERMRFTGEGFLQISTSGSTFTTTASYETDVSSLYSDRSLVDKGYVDSLVSDSGSTTPSTPTGLQLLESGDSVSIGFSSSLNSEWYEIWRSQTSTSAGFSFVGKIDSDSIGDDMLVVDNTYTIQGQLWYRVYAVNGKYSEAVSGSITTTDTVDDVTNMEVQEYLDSYEIKYDIPEDRRLDYVEVKYHAHADLASLSEGSSVQLYTGNRNNYVHTIQGGDETKYHQFWIYTYTRT